MSHRIFTQPCYRSLRRAVLFVCMLLAAQGTRAQTVEAGLRATVNSTWLINKNVSDKGSAQSYAVSIGNSYGIMGGLFLAEFTEITGEIHINKHLQKYTGTTSGGIKYESQNTLHTWEVPIMLRLLSKSLGYFELGAQYSIVKSAEHENDLPGFEAFNGITTADWAKANLSPVMGFGTDIKLIDNTLLMTLGLRASTGLFDMKGTDGLGTDLSDSSLYPKYQRTNSITVGLLFGVSLRM
ncbi:MAG: hypothetical protein H6585_06875 [Flavobacteriales bacterium]|nr:hypothetical protein [Flavobacteriales bacterium]MCB9448054.1 hypothetical protein [Flavobacteriales bacterium]